MLSYPWFLVLCGCAFVAAERLWPRHRTQRLLRRGVALDAALMVFHSEIGGWAVAMLLARVVPQEIFAPYRLGWIASMPLWLETLALWIVKDLVQWLVHRLMHKVPWLWRIHALHHSSEELDWLSNWRFHPLETLVYQAALYVPAFLLGFRWEASLACAFLSTGVSHFAHANLGWRLGAVKYVLNTPEFHVWHHAHPDAGPQNRNFGVSFVVWDWMFGTAYCPESAPSRLGRNDAATVTGAPRKCT
jgi:sterol desaturase/sphingolipid hydroxylase (fatty acid hydroxylase superfamily)